jgi:DNA-binding transcriptional regulator YdaS (Cro superfamily)
MTPLERAAEALGGFGALAESIGVAQSTPSMWKARGKVPVEHCLAIERATQGAVTRAELRPDDYFLIWPDLVAPPEKAVSCD